jgi:hypothetical protein
MRRTRVLAALCAFPGARKAEVKAIVARIET